MLKQSTKQLLESFRCWHIYQTRTVKELADHLRWCRSAMGYKLARERQRQLLPLRRFKGKAMAKAILIESGYYSSSPPENEGS